MHVLYRADTQAHTGAITAAAVTAAAITTDAVSIGGVGELEGLTLSQHIQITDARLITE